MNDEPTIRNHNEQVKGFKTAKKDEGGYYTDGNREGKKTYFKEGDILEAEGDLELCRSGIHFFRHLCFAVEYFGDDTAGIFEVESVGRMQEDTEKCVTSKLLIGRSVTEEEIKQKVDGNWNAGDGNAGDRNAGNRNAGYGNAGDRNAGNWNAGDRNAGDRNAGHWNAGSWNAGHGNAGHGNAGHGNAGHWNAGSWNAGSFNSGNGYQNHFCRETRYYIFDREVKKLPDWYTSMPTYWFDIIGRTYKEAWMNCPESVREILRTNITEKDDRETFIEITGLDLWSEKQEVTK